MTDQPGSLAEALALLQTRLPDIKKASKAQYGAYADLADVSRALLPVIGDLGLSFISCPTWVQRDDGTRDFVLSYALRHTSGEWIEGEYPLGTNVANHQAIGSAITYGRRYCLCAVTGAVADDDDDGQAASAQSPPAAAQKPRGRPKPPERAPGNLPTNADGSVSRSRATDVELAAAGNMTDAQIREHGRLEREVKGTGPQGTERLTETPADDPWYMGGETVLHPPTVRTPRAAPSKAQQIVMHFERLGVADKSVRLGYTAQLAGLEFLRSTNDLTAQQGIAVEKKLASCKDADAFDRLIGITFDKLTEARGD